MLHCPGCNTPSHKIKSSPIKRDSMSARGATESTLQVMPTNYLQSEHHRTGERLQHSSTDKDTSLTPGEHKTSCKK